jgi:cobalamin synthase
MSRRPWSSRFALWAAVCALLLKAAVPMLATASAHAQGKALVEVCTVYGVAMVALPDSSTPPASDELAVHASDHCALGALVALAVPPTATPPFAATTGQASPAPAHPSPQAPDACATWVARLKHGPPTSA